MALSEQVTPQIQRHEHFGKPVYTFINMTHKTDQTVIKFTKPEGFKQ